MVEQFVKVHGSGNTFYIIEATTEEMPRWISLAKWLCHKGNQGGGDGLLVVLPSKVATAKMRIINADGSEASMCGNGLRCVARFVCEKLQVQEATIETMKVTLHVKKVEPLFENLPTYAVEIAPVYFELEQLPMFYPGKTTIQHECLEFFSSTIPYTAVAVPNPHLIGLVDQHYIEHIHHQQLLAQFLNGPNDYCPDGINVSYVYPISRDEIFVRTFERGVGFTNACGTAMTAAAYVAYHQRYVSNHVVTVYNPGGFVQCQIEGTAEAPQLLLTGNATFTAYGEVTERESDWDWLHFELTDEQQQYLACQNYVNQKIAGVLTQSS